MKFFLTRTIALLLALHSSSALAAPRALSGLSARDQRSDVANKKALLETRDALAQPPGEVQRQVDVLRAEMITQQQHVKEMKEEVQNKQEHAEQFETDLRNLQAQGSGASQDEITIIRTIQRLGKEVDDLEGEIAKSEELIAHIVETLAHTVMAHKVQKL